MSGTKDTVVVGLGNRLMGDEGIGVALIAELSWAAGRFPNAEFLDLGTGGMAVLHAIASRRKAVLVDCARMGEEPGTIRRFEPEDVRSRKRRAGVSLHEADLLGVIELSRWLGECPEQVVLLGIEPFSVSAGSGLSPALRDRMDRYVSAVIAELE